jgi:hypothetical protein
MHGETVKKIDQALFTRTTSVSAYMCRSSHSGNDQWGIVWRSRTVSTAVLKSWLMDILKFLLSFISHNKRDKGKHIIIKHCVYSDKLFLLRLHKPNSWLFIYQITKDIVS